MRRRPSLTLGTVYAWSALAGAADLTDADIVALDAVALRAELAAGRVSAERITQVFLQRIAALDDSGPMLGAVIEINPDAEAIARALDRRRDGQPLGELHGLPVLVKANIDTADRMATSAGSRALAAHHAAADAALVTRLRAAGAVLLGKTNLSEWANFRSTASTSGWSSLGGQTRNPYVLDRNPCGSSSGAAVAVAAGLAPLAIGTETDGSIVCPAATNGVVGIKPTVGLVSAYGIVPLAPSQDTAGPLARTVAGAALLLDALVEPGAVGATARSVAAGDTLIGVRIGVVRNYFGAERDAPVEAAFAAALRVLDNAGAVLVDPANPSLGPESSTAESSLLLAEFRDNVAQYLSHVTNGPRTLNDLIEFNSAHAGDVMPHFGQELLIAARDSGGAANVDYRNAVTTIAAERRLLAELFATQELDVLVAPANARAWRTDYRAGDAVGVSSSSIAAVSGYPSITVPVRLATDLPLGIAFIGKPREEALLIEIAAIVERLRGPFPRPQFLPSTTD